MLRQIMSIICIFIYIEKEIFFYVSTTIVLMIAKSARARERERVHDTGSCISIFEQVVLCSGCVYVFSIIFSHLNSLSLLWMVQLISTLGPYHVCVCVCVPPMNTPERLMIINRIYHSFGRSATKSNLDNWDIHASG